MLSFNNNKTDACLLFAIYRLATACLHDEAPTGSTVALWAPRTTAHFASPAVYAYGDAWYVYELWGYALPDGWP